jgi:hypothetical protein
MKEDLQLIDHTAIKVNQAAIIVLNIVAFVFNAPWLVIIVTIAMIVGVFRKVPGFGFLYRFILKPLGWVKTDILLDNPEPHRFAQGLGSIFMAAGSLALLSNLPLIGWSMIWLVTSLAALNLFVGFCVGCMFYYWLTHLNVPGFHKAPPGDTFPGMRPKTRRYHES